MRHEMRNLLSHLGRNPGRLATTTQHLGVVVLARSVHDGMHFIRRDLFLSVDRVQTVDLLFDIGSTPLAYRPPDRDRERGLTAEYKQHHGNSPP